MRMGKGEDREMRRVKKGCEEVRGWGDGEMGKWEGEGEEG